jgi:hypothetical protein
LRARFLIQRRVSSVPPRGINNCGREQINGEKGSSSFLKKEPKDFYLLRDTSE